MLQETAASLGGLRLWDRRNYSSIIDFRVHSVVDN